VFKELQSLGMDVKILSENEEEIVMRELDDEDDSGNDKLNLNLESAEVKSD
jgi:DNA-directed RNA polymerase subunit beta